MEYVKKYKWALGGLIVMVLLNIATLVTIWTIQPPQPFIPEEDPLQGRVQKFMERELNLSDQQVQTFRRLRMEHMQETRALNTKLHQNRRKFYEALSDSTAHSKRDSLARIIGNCYVDIERSMHEHFAELKSVLGPEQQQKFEELTRQSLWMQRHEGQRRGREYRRRGEYRGNR